MAERSTSEPGFMGRHHFLLRRLHSLSGIVPVGVFVIFHLFANAQLATGTYQHEVDWLYGTVPALLIVEISLWLAIAFHAGLGLVYTFVGNQPNVARYRYGGNWRYFFQRVTGIIALIFIFLHVATLRWQWDLAGWYTPFMVNDEASGTPLAQATVAMALENPWVVLLYIVGSLSVIYHWSNGLWTAAITWGLTLSVAAQRRWGYVCAAMGVVLTLFLAAAIYGAVTTEVTEEERQIFQQALDQDAEEVLEDADAAP
ncbi:MAG: hypothetical protein WD534_17225 [Phycisphaeraceae bacterium]